MDQELRTVGAPDFEEERRIPKLTTYSESTVRAMKAMLGEETTLTLIYYAGEPASSSFARRLECLLGRKGAEVIIARINPG